LVFPNGIGKVESYANLVERDFGPIQVAAGVVTLVPVLDATGDPIINNAGDPIMREIGKYGLHALRHACASLWIEHGHNPKQIQTLMGHSSIKVTFDTYGHLFADPEADQRAAEGVELRLLGA
jgi:integrase